MNVMRSLKFDNLKNFSFLNLFSLPSGENNLELRNKFREIGVFYWACIIFAPYFIAEQSFHYQTTRYFPILIPLYAVLALAPLIYRKTVSFNVYATYIAIFGIALVILLIAYEGGNRSPGAFWLMGVPLIFGLVNGSRGVLIGTFVMVATFIVFLILNHWHMLPNLVAEHGDYELEKLINLVGFGIYNVVTSYYFINTEEKTQKELRTQKQEIEDLLRILVHDVATPINAIQLLTHTAKTKKREPEEIVILIDETLNELSAILQQVRKLRALKDGKWELSLSNVPVQSALISTINFLQQQANDKSIKFILDIDQNPAWVIADETLLKSVIFCNLINNAIKFSHPGQTITIYLKVLPKWVEIVFEDQGIGIPEKLILHIFEPGAPTTRRGTKGEHGTGYGMPLVKTLITKFCGEINLISSDKTELSGTIVTIRLPVVFQ